MGMFDRDIAFGGVRADEVLAVDEPFVLWDCAIGAINVPTSFGRADKATLVISVLKEDGTPDDPMDVRTFASSITDKVKRKRDGDLPAVCRVHHVPSSFGKDAYVLTFIKRWKGEVLPSEELMPETVIDLSEETEPEAADAFDKSGESTAVRANRKAAARKDDGGEVPF